jgi:hypothetical protein
LRLGFRGVARRDDVYDVTIREMGLIVQRAVTAYNEELHAHPDAPMSFTSSAAYCADLLRHASLGFALASQGGPAAASHAARALRCLADMEEERQVVEDEIPAQTFAHLTVA